MVIQEYVNIKNYSTLRVGGQFRYFCVVSSVTELASVCAMAQTDAKYKNVPIFVLGGGSNIVFPDGILNAITIKNEIKGFEVINETDQYTDVKIGGGEVWDEIVLKTVEMNLSGLEPLSAIPGTVGASPVQNVGAYGAEVKDTILEVEGFDITSGKIFTFSNKECKFGYRDSIFKNEARGKYVVTSVTYRLANCVNCIPMVPNYPGVKRYFLDNNINGPSLKEIREAVISIRNSKLPALDEYPNVGSFFKNPIVQSGIALEIQNKFPDLKLFSMENGLKKIPAGWLIENAGLKGQSFGKVSVYDKNALILVNNGDATKEDIVSARNEIIKVVQNKFGIVLEQEPEII